jgi:SEC-C motif-containing protein
MNMTSISKCYCGSNQSYSKCCQPFHDDQKRPETPEQLMRSRYSAYVVGNIDYIAKTNDVSGEDNFDREAAEIWSKKSEWLGLEIVAAHGNEVEFRAKFKTEGKEIVHHEVSLFRFDEAQKRWFYTDGKEIREPLKVENKIGRNDPCSCGSGKKYKKCCG